MKELFEVLTKIREALGGDKCEAMAITNEFGGCTIRVNWYDGSDYRVQRRYSYDEITSVVDTGILVDHFITWAKRQKEIAKES